VVELLEAVGGVAIIVVLIAVLLWALYFAFGPQALGLPAMLGAFVLVAGWKIAGNSGVGGLVAVVLGVAAILLIIGMAMSFGGRPPRAEQERPPDEPWEKKRDRP
jgi:hypothetical protein